MVRDLIVGALNHLMLIKLPYALKAERVAARQRYRLLLIMVVRLEADATFKYLIHFLL